MLFFLAVYSFMLMLSYLVLHRIFCFLMLCHLYHCWREILFIIQLLHVTLTGMLWAMLALIISC